MALTTNELISNSYFSSGIVSREFQTVSGQEITDGLTYLNDIIAEKTVDEGMIPYETEANLTAIVGQEEYFIPNLISIDTLTFFKDSVRYSMRYQKRNQYFGSNRVESIDSLPFAWYFERQFKGGNLFIYFEPDQPYLFEIHGVFRLTEVALNQDLSLTLDRFYTTYLKYALADRLCTEYNYTTPVNVTKQLGRYEAFINKKSRLLDLRMQKVSTLHQRGGIHWAYVNLGNGFHPTND